MTTEMTNTADVNDQMNDILADLGFSTNDEIIEPVEEIAVREFDIEEAVIKGIENQEALREHYESEEENVVTDAVAPTPAAPVEKKAKRVKKTAEEKAAAVEARKAKKAEAAEKAPKAPRKFYTSKAERVSDKVGGFVLTLTDAALTGEALAAKQAEVLDLFTNGKVGVKVQNRMTLLMEFVEGKSSKLNEVISRAFNVLKRDGFIRSGEKGNLHVDLMTKYSAATARATGNNTIAAMKMLQVIHKNSDGAYVRNDDSLIAIRMQSLGY